MFSQQLAEHTSRQETTPFCCQLAEPSPCPSPACCPSGSWEGQLAVVVALYTFNRSRCQCSACPTMWQQLTHIGLASLSSLGGLRLGCGSGWPHLDHLDEAVRQAHTLLLRQLLTCVLHSLNVLQNQYKNTRRLFS